MRRASTPALLRCRKWQQRREEESGIPLQLARSLSAVSVDTVTSNQLTITYRIFNSRDEEIGEPLLVVHLASGVTLLSATPVPDQPAAPWRRCGPDYVARPPTCPSCGMRARCATG